MVRCSSSLTHTVSTHLPTLMPQPTINITPASIRRIGHETGGYAGMVWANLWLWDELVEIPLLGIGSCDAALV